MQRADAKLKPAWHKASLGKGGFIVRSGLLMKKRAVNVLGDNDYVLVLPDCKKRQVLVAAHDDPRSGGHVGFRRTYQKISRVFYMPKREIKEFCATCIECQRLKPKCINERVDYVIPTIEEEFGRTWIIDVIGPTMERMSRKFGGHAHILVCIEAATRWVELIALPSLKATALAAAIESNLIARFACRKLVYDLQSGLMSDLMQSVLKLLRVNSYVSVAGFHSRTAVAERYCRTVERYLKPYLEDYKGKWGLLLPWISFQLRQAPCSFTHFSPHELVLGKNLPDQLDDLRDDFMGLTDSAERGIKTNVLSYVNGLRRRLSLTRELASKHAVNEHERTKAWYDRHCTPDKSFKTGDKVLVLEPVDSRKMFVKWSEPAEIVRPVGLRTYEVRLADDTVKSYHINQLRAFEERTEFVCPVVVAADIRSNAEDVYLNAVEDDVSDPLKFRIDESQPAEHRERIQKLLLEFKDVFSSSLGCTNIATHTIELTDNTPCVSKSYRIPEALKQPLEEEINRLLEAGVLRYCSSPYRAPLIPIVKPDKSLRLVNAYQGINEKTVDDLYPMSNPMDILSKAAGKKYVSKLDLSKSFLQIPLDERSQPYTAFSTSSHGTLCWTRCCLGLRNSPRTMQRAMDHLLRGLSSLHGSSSSFCGCLIDDIVLASNTIDDHVFHLKMVLSRLKEANFTVSLAKSEFLMRSMTVLGYCLEDGYIKPSQKHIEAVLRIGPQRTKAGVRAILGTLGYHRAMVPKFAEITYPLTELLKKNQPERNIKWEQKHSDAVQQIKNILTSKPILIAPNHNRDYIIMCDATEKTIAGILAQKGEDGIEYNVAYFSRKLLPNEINYSVMEKEALGILACCLKWHDWIYAKKVTARTDHRALAFLESTAQHNARIARWKIILSNYQLSTEYRRASDHANCDGLSRVEVYE